MEAKEDLRVKICGLSHFIDKYGVESHQYSAFILLIIATLGITNVN